MNEEMSDGKCLQLQIRFGIRYQWILSDLTKFYAGECLESSPLFFQNGNGKKCFKLNIMKAKPKPASFDDGDTMYFLRFNFGSAFLEESSYHLYYCICNTLGQQMTKLETIELHVANGKIAPFYVSFIADSELRETIDEFGALIIDVFMLDVTLPQMIGMEMVTDDCSVEDDRETDKETPCDNLLTQLYNNNSMSDVILLVKGQQFFVHKNVLTSKSSTILPTISKNEVVSITIDDFDPAVVIKMLSYMYLNSVSNIDDIVFDLYRIAKKYHVDGLIKVCVTCLIKKVTLENVITIFVFAVKNGIKDLIQRTKAVIASNVGIVLDSDGFNKMIDCYDFGKPGL